MPLTSVYPKSSYLTHLSPLWVPLTSVLPYSPLISHLTVTYLFYKPPPGYPLPQSPLCYPWLTWPHCPPSLSPQTYLTVLPPSTHLLPITYISLPPLDTSLPQSPLSNPWPMTIIINLDWITIINYYITKKMTINTSPRHATVLTVDSCPKLNYSIWQLIHKLLNFRCQANLLIYSREIWNLQNSFLLH